jgi:phosphoribosylformylglycinamidine (FGAM) synthase-like enzyme
VVGVADLVIISVADLVVVVGGRSGGDGVGGGTRMPTVWRSEGSFADVVVVARGFCCMWWWWTVEETE